MNHVYGLVGCPLGHSFSRSFFQAKFEREGIAATYENFEMPDLSGLRQLITDRRELCGLNVTIPYKTEVIALLDELDPTYGQPYSLNVSSPGLDRPFNKDRDFLRNVGKKVELKLYAPHKGEKNFEAVLLGYDPAAKCVEIDKAGEVFKLNLTQIVKISQAIDFD